MVSGLPQSDLVHAEFGFSQLWLVTPRGLVGLGRLGAGCFRVTSQADFDDERLIATCHALDAGRALLGIFPADAQTRTKDALVRARSVRLSVDIKGLCQALA